MSAHAQLSINNRQYLRRGDGIIATPESRRKAKARLFGSGRLTLASSGIKLGKLMGDGYDYEPAADTSRYHRYVCKCFCERLR